MRLEGWICWGAVAGPFGENNPVIACGALLDGWTDYCLLRHHIVRSLALSIPVAHGD